MQVEFEATLMNHLARVTDIAVLVSLVPKSRLGTYHKRNEQL